MGQLLLCLISMFKYGNRVVCFNAEPYSHITGLKVTKHFSGTAQLSMKFILPINVKMPKIVTVGILTFEPRREKTGFLHMRKQRRRSASW